MRSSTLAKSVILTLAFALATPLAPFIQTTGAQVSPGSTSLHTAYLPWIPNAETINNQGPWYGKLLFQNLSDDLCAISIFLAREGSWSKTAQLTLAGGSSRSISSRSLAIPTPGAPVRIEGECPISASVKIVTPDVNHSPWSDGAISVTGYTGISDLDLAASMDQSTSGWFLPIVQTNSNWNTHIRVANLDPEHEVDVTINLLIAENSPQTSPIRRTIVRTLTIGSTELFDVLEEVRSTGWVGYAEIRASGPIGVYAHRSKPSARMTLINVATSADSAASGGRYVLGAPLLFTAYNGWNTGINLANLSSETANVTIRYSESGVETLTREEELQIPARTMRYIYTPNNVQQAGFVGAATIESDVSLAAAIDEVKYETIEGITYSGSTVGQQSAAIPVTFRGDPENGRHDNSGINVLNLNPDQAQSVEITLIDNSGDEVVNQPFVLTIPAGGNNFMYLPDLPNVPAGTVAATRIEGQDPMGFVALSNDVNYAVSGDGSVTFMAVGGAGYYRLLGSPAP